MKFRNLLLATVACAGLFTACSNGIDEAIDNGGNETNNGEKAYASFSIQMPAGTGLTRANGNGEDVGLDEEGVVSSVTLLFFKNDGSRSLADIKTITPTVTDNKAVYTTGALDVTKGSRVIYAFVNAQPAIQGLTINDNGAAWQKIMGAGAETAASMSGDNMFTMSNAKQVTAEIKHTTVKDANDNPLPIPVERTVAKVQYTGEIGKAHEIKRGDATLGTVTLSDLKLVNTNTKYFYLKRVSEQADGSDFTVGGAEIDGKTFVVDPNFVKETTDVADFKTGAYTPLAQNVKFYCLENTMTTASQYNGVTTGVMFQAKFKLAGQDDATTFYRYNGEIYTTAEAVKKAAKITDNTDAWKVSDWAARYVDYYENGICYYPYWIKHYNNYAGSAMGMMEFGVVRNNVYKLGVTKINEIGAPTDKVDPENPDKGAYTYLTVSIEVLKWTVRSNEDIIL